MKRYELVFLLAVAIVATVPRVLVAQDEGSGDYDDLDDDEMSEPVIVPTRVIPELQSPAPSLPKVNSDNIPASLGPTLLPPGREDQIFIEEGSGDDRFTPTYRGGPSVTPNMPMLPPPRNREEVISTEVLSNSPPILQKHLMKIPVVAGRTRRWRIPEDTFFDAEDGNTRNLRLNLRYPNGSLVRPDHWIRLNNISQELWILPVNENDIGSYQFRLTAQDRSGQTVEDVLEVMVRQYSRSRLVNHKFELTFSFTNWKPSIVQNWEWKMLEKLRQFFDDPNLENIIVREVDLRPFRFAWTNSSLVQPECNKKEIEAMYRRMSGRNGEPSLELKETIGSTVFLKSITLSFSGSCLDEARRERIGSGNLNLNNNQPVIRNPIDRINVTAGELLRFRVPEDTCYDKEDGSTSSLSLHLLTMSRRELSPKSWLKFDFKNQEFLGVPLEEEVGREEFQLVCSDRDGLSVIDGIEIIVYQRPFTERFDVEFALDFEDFFDISPRRVDLVEVIASYFGDESPSNVVVKSISDNRFVWYNKSLSANTMECQDPRIGWMESRIKTPKGRLSPELEAHFRSHNMQLSNASVILRGGCIFTTPFPEVTQRTHQNIFHGLIPSSEYLMTFLVPAIIISIMLLLAILLACFLHRKRKAGKLNLFYSEALPPRVPVILQDELYEDNDPRKMLGHHQPGEPEEVDRLIQGTRIVMQSGPGSSGRPTPTYRRA